MRTRGNGRLWKMVFVAGLVLLLAAVHSQVALGAASYSIQTIGPLSFSGTAGAALANQTFSVSDTSPISALFTAVADKPWLVVVSASATTVPGNAVVVGVRTTGLSAGTYSGHIILTIPNQSGYTWSNSPYAVPVTLTISAASQSSSGLGSTTSASGTPETIQPIGSVSFSGMTGAALSSRSFSISDTSPISANYSVTADKPWITIVSAGSTTAPGNAVVVNVKTAGLAPGTYSGHAIVTIPSQSGYVWTNSPYAVLVTLAISGTSQTSTSSTSSLTSSASQTPETIQPIGALSFSGAAGAVLASESFTVSDTSPISATYTATVDQPWLSIVSASPNSAPGNAVVVSVKSAGMAPGTYTGHAIVNIPGQSGYTWTNSPYPVTVTLNVTSGSAPTLTLSSSSVAFGNVNVLSSSSQSVKLTNSGTSNVNISNVTISGAGFGVTGVSSGQILTAGQSATLTANFAPASAGSVTGSISIASNAANSPDPIALTGTGVTATTSHSVALTWAPSTSSSIVGYNAYSATTSGGPYTKLNSSPVPTQSYTDTTVQAGNTYYYVVTAVDTSNLESAHSAEVSTTVP